MPSSQTPPAGSTALDPTAVRPDIDDARIIRTTPAEVRALLEGLKTRGFTMLLDIGGADYPGREPRFDVVYHLLAIAPTATTVAAVGKPERVRVLCGVPEDATAVPTMSDLWPAADWAEREVFDLFGIAFIGHPDMRRIQMPNDWEGFPLRKDYPLRGPAREKSPRPSFALKSNVGAGTPASGKTAAALQRQIAVARGQALPATAAPDTAGHGSSPGAVTTAGQATTAELAAEPDTAKGGQTLKDNTK
jgi:NADH:ubiquinone oxidoreductase subunit C